MIIIKLYWSIKTIEVRFHKKWYAFDSNYVWNSDTMGDVFKIKKELLMDIVIIVQIYMLSLIINIDKKTVAYNVTE